MPALAGFAVAADPAPPGTNIGDRCELGRENA